MYRDRIAFMERLCKETFKLYIVSIKVCHRAAIDPDVCEAVAVGFADTLFEESSTPINNVLIAFLHALESLEKGRGKKLQDSFLAEMRKVQETAISDAIIESIGGTLN